MFGTEEYQIALDESKGDMTYAEFKKIIGLKF